MTAQLVGPIDFPDIADNGFADSVGNPAYYNLGAGNNNNVEARWYGDIMIPGTGTAPVPINFATTSDDGSMLYIDGNAVVNNNNFQAPNQATGMANLTPGLHTIDVEYYQGGGGATMDVQWDPTGGTNFVDIPNSAFGEPVNSLIKTGTGTTTLQAALDNIGLVSVQQGTLSIQGGGALGSTYLVLAGATLTFGNDNVTPTSFALPGDFTTGALDWSATFTGTAQDNSGSGLASAGVSLFDGTNYYDGTAFDSPTAVFNAAALSGNSWSYAIDADNFQSDLPYAAASEATDNQGGSEPSTIASVLLSPSLLPRLPAVSAVAPAIGPTAGGTTVTITGTALANATAVDFGTIPATIVSDSDTTIVATSPLATAAGIVQVTVTTAGGTSATSPADRFTYVAAPAVGAVAPAIGPTAGGTTVTITGTALANATAVDFGTMSAAIVSDTDTTIVVTSPLATAAGIVQVTVTTAGGTSATSPADQFTYVAAPAVSAVAPAIGPTAGGTTVTITGTALANATAVDFGTIPAAIVSDTDTTIIVTSPLATAAGIVQVTVTTAGGTSATSAADQFTYVAAPAVSAVAPAIGPTSGGTTVTITGTALANATAVDFGTIPAAIVSDTDTTIIVTSPLATAAGIVQVTVTTAGGTSATSAAGEFTYVAAPAVSAVAPAIGPTAGGTTVTITGTALANATAVDFGTIPAAIVSDTDTTIVVTSPLATAAGIVQVTVTTAGGTSATSAAGEFTYVAAPAVSAVAPAIGPTAGGTTVTITGTALANATAVDFGTMSAAIVSDTDTTIVVTSPPATAAGIVQVTVTTAGGTSATSAADQFTYDDPPTSTVAALPATTTKTSFTVSWSGSDGNGPGIASYSVYVSDNGGSYKPFVTATTKTSAVFTAKVGHTYAFYSVATDRLGVVQPTPESAQATTKVVLPPPVMLKRVVDITNKKHKVTEVLVTFSGPVNATEADETRTYRLAKPGKRGSYTAKNAAVIKLKSALYTGANDTVALTPVRPFALNKPVQLLVYGTGATALRDTYGRPIDGAKNAIAILSKGGARIEAIALGRSAGPAARLAALDAALESKDLAVLRRS